MTIYKLTYKGKLTQYFIVTNTGIFYAYDFMDIGKYQAAETERELQDIITKKVDYGYKLEVARI